MSGACVCVAFKYLHAPENSGNFFFRKLHKLSAWIKPPEKFSVLQSMQNKIKMQNGKNGGEGWKVWGEQKIHINEYEWVHTDTHVFACIYECIHASPNNKKHLKTSPTGATLRPQGVGCLKHGFVGGGGRRGSKGTSSWRWFRPGPFSLL